MIPTNRPVLGKDLNTVREQFGMLTADACWLFGLSMTRWMKLVRHYPDIPVKDPSLALLVRFLDQNPDLAIIPKAPDVQAMYDLINVNQETGQRRFSVLFGSEASATYRWLRVGSRQSPSVQRLMHYMRLSILSAPEKKRHKIIQDWEKTVQAEGQARGEDDVLSSGVWNRKVKDLEIETAQKAIDEAPNNRKKGKASKMFKEKEAAAKATM